MTPNDLPCILLSMVRAAGAAPRDDAEARSERESRDATMDAKLDEVARAALGGGASALRNFLGAAAPIVRRVCRGVMGRDHEDLEDAIQDCLIEVARALPQFRFEGPVSHYLLKIAMRRAIAWRQRARARSKQYATLDPSMLPVATVDGALEARAELVRKLLDDLNEEQAKALLLRIMLGYSLDEIADITGVSVNTVKTRLRLAKEQLRRWLQRRGEGRRARS